MVVFPPFRRYHSTQYKMIKKRKICVGVLVLASILVSMGVIATCPVMAEQKIRVMMLPDPHTRGVARLLPAFSGRTGIKVELEEAGWDVVHSNAINDFVTHGGKYDVVIMDNPWLPEYVPYLENLIPWFEKIGLDVQLDYQNKWPPGTGKYPTIRVEDAIVPVLNFYGNWEGGLYAVPQMPGVELLMYRKDLFNDPKERAAFKAKYGYELGVPKTWAEFYDIAEFFTQPPELYGFSTSVGVPNMAVQNYYNIAWSMGADCLAFSQGTPDPDDPIRNMPILNSPLGVKALEYLVSLRPFMPPGVEAYMWVEPTNDMSLGKVAMIWQWSDVTTDLENPEASKVAGKVGYAMLPGDPDAPVNNVPGVIPGKGYASLGGWALVMNKDSKNKEAAAKFIAFACQLTMTERELVDYLNYVKGTSAKVGAYLMPGILGYDVGRYPVELEVYRGYVRRRPFIAEVIDYEIVVGTEVTRAFLGEKTPQQALDDAAKGMYELMKVGGYIPEDQPLVWPSKYVNPDGTLVK